MKLFTAIAASAALVSAAAGSAATRPNQAMPVVGKSVRAATSAKDRSDLVGVALLPLILGGVALTAVVVAVAAGQSNG